MKKYVSGFTPLAARLLRSLPELVPPLPVLRARQGGEGAGLLVDVRTPSGRRRTLQMEAAVAASPGRLPGVLQRLAAPRTAAYPVFATRFLSPRSRTLCKEAGVGYLDLAGNCFLRFDDFYFERVVDKNPFPARGRPPSLFAPASSRLVRALLEEPRRRWQVSELSAAVGISLGQASNVSRRLVEEGYAVRDARRVALAQPAALLNAWQEQPAPPRGETAYYSFEQPPERLMAKIAQAAASHRLRYAVTSFAAASLIAPFVHGISAVQWYVEDEAGRDAWVRALDLRPVESGPNAILLTPSDPGVWYRTQAADGVQLVGTVQLYLDLVRDPGRGREQAVFLREQRMGF